MNRVSSILLSRLGPSLTLLIPLTFLETGLAIALGLAVAYVRGSLTDRMIMIVCTVGMSVSILVYIIVFQYLLAYKLGWFPVQGWGENWVQDLFKYSSLPILILLVVSIAPNLRLYRTFMLDEIGQDYVRTARAKGLSEKRILWVHVLAQCDDSHHYLRDVESAVFIDRRFSGRALLFDTGDRP